MKKLFLGFIIFWYCTPTFADIVIPQCSNCPPVEYNYASLFSSLRYLHIGGRTFGKDIIHPLLFVVIVNILVIIFLLFRRWRKKHSQIKTN